MVVDGEVGRGEFQIQQIAGPGEVKGRGLLSGPQALGEQVGDVVGAEGLEFQQVLEESSKAVLLRWTIGQGEKGGLIGEWLTPTNVFVNRGVMLADVAEKPLTLPFASCSSGYCRAVANLAPDFTQTLEKAETVSLTYYPLDSGPLTLRPSTKGLSTALSLMAPAP